jgi:hypothetical protein
MKDWFEPVQIPEQRIALYQSPLGLHGMRHLDPGMPVRRIKSLPRLKFEAKLSHEKLSADNEFNHADRDEDKLAELRLPMTGEGTIEIAFRSNRGRRVNVLAALNEGHIRRLGLAILLAKAQNMRARSSSSTMR